METIPVPAAPDIIWDNMHVAKILVETRRAWSNMCMSGLLLLWSLFVAIVRSQAHFSRYLPFRVQDSSVISAVLDSYLPILILEGSVRSVPFILRGCTNWCRFKTTSESDTYVIRWYFLFRMVTFVFAIVGESLVAIAKNLINDPYDFVRAMAREVPRQSQ